MLKREIKRQIERYGKFFDGVLAVMFVLLVVVPIISVINLSPTVMPLTSENQDVLGALSYSGTEVELKKVGGSHEYIQNEEFYDQGDNTFLYSTRIQKREPGVYSKPVLMLNVPEGMNIKVTFSIASSEVSSTQIGITYDNRNEVLRASDGQQYIKELVFDKSGSYDLLLDVRNNNSVNFPEDIDVRISVSEE